jgi:hypothetical protein
MEFVLHLLALGRGADDAKVQYPGVELAAVIGDHTQAEVRTLRRARSLGRCREFQARAPDAVISASQRRTRCEADSLLRKSAFCFAPQS